MDVDSTCSGGISAKAGVGLRVACFGGGDTAPLVLGVGLLDVCLGRFCALLVELNLLPATPLGAEASF
jgi:hypothetical protein